MKIKSQGKLMELVVGTIFVVFIMIIIFFYYYSNYNQNIEKLMKRNAYERQTMIYEIITSDQAFAISSKDKGYLDKAKLDAILNIGNDREVCEFLESIVGGKAYIYIKDLQTLEEYEICKDNKNSKKGLLIFDTFTNIYDPYTREIRIAYVKIGVIP